MGRQHREAPRAATAVTALLRPLQGRLLLTLVEAVEVAAMEPARLAQPTRVAAVVDERPPRPTTVAAVS